MHNFFFHFFHNPFRVQKDNVIIQSLKVPDNCVDIGMVLVTEKLEEALKLCMVLLSPDLECLLVKILLKDAPLGKVLSYGLVSIILKRMLHL